MKICTANSSRGPHCQIMRIEDGFRALGHEIVLDMREADLIYQNNFWFDPIIDARKRGEVKGKLIFNVLDIPEHILTQFDLKEAEEQLLEADAVTSISQFTKEQVNKFFNIESSIIYQPIMDLDLTENTDNLMYDVKTNVFVHVGRRTDPNKRFNGVYNIVSHFPNYHLFTIGGENLDLGKNHTYLGSISEKLLSTYYQEASYSFSLGKIEGLNLPVVEAIHCGSIPIIASDLTTRQELLPAELFPEYNWFYNAENIVKFIVDMDKDPNHKKLEFKNRLKSHYEKNLKDKFNKISVAKAIIDVYNKL